MTECPQTENLLEKCNIEKTAQVTNLQTSLSTVRGQHAIDLGELEENRRRLRDLAARINHLEEANADLDERAKGMSKDMNARLQQENQEVTYRDLKCVD